MNIILNSKSTNVPDHCSTVGEILDFLDISRKGTGVGVNNKLVKASDWDSFKVNEGDSLTVITAAYGG